MFYTKSFDVGLPNDDPPPGQKHAGVFNVLIQLCKSKDFPFFGELLLIKTQRNMLIRPNYLKPEKEVIKYEIRKGLRSSFLKYSQ
jgi:hypothetical protein